MYFRRSLAKILKVRPLVRYSHSGYARPFLLLKYDEKRNAKGSVHLSNASKSFCSENFNKNGKENEKNARKSRTVGIDLMAPNLSGNHLMFKSATKSRKETAGKFHTMPQKSLTLKMCRQPSKNLSTSHSNDTTTGECTEKTETTKKRDSFATKSKADICRAICAFCGPHSSSSTLKNAKSSTFEVSERIAIKLTNAEIDEICKSRPCMESNEKVNPSNSAAHTKQTAKKLEDPSTTIHQSNETKTETIQSTEKLEDPSATIQSNEIKTETIPSREKLEDPSATIQSVENLERPSTTIRSAENPEGSSTNTQSVENLQNTSSAFQLAHPKSFFIKKRNRNEISGPSSQIRRTKKAKRPSMTTIENRNIKRNRSGVGQSYQIQNMAIPKIPNFNSHQRAPPTTQYRHVLRDIRYGPFMANDPRLPSRPIAPYNLLHPKNKFRHIAATGSMNSPMHPMEPRGTPSHIKSKYEMMIRSMQSRVVSFGRRPTHEPNIAFRTQMKRNINPCPGFTGNVCHFEQLRPVPFRFRPIYDKNYHSDPVVENRSPRFNGTQFGVPYRSTNQLQWHKRHRQQKLSPVFGSKSNKNRQTVDIPKWFPNSAHIAEKTLANNNIAADFVSNSENSLNPNNKEELASWRAVDTAQQQSRKIMSKLVENLSVVIEGPAKLKLVTSSYPQLRDEKDVIIQMEYVNLTDADTRHFLSGKYNSYSYATTAVGRTGSGTIIETGENVHNVKPGDKVFVKPVSCGKCSLCLADRRNICEYVTVSEISTVQGVLSRLHVHSSEFVRKIPDNVSMLNGAMTWTLSTAIRACQKSGITAGDVIVVIGGGPLGTATCLAAQQLGATTVCLVDTRNTVLEEAQKLGIAKVFQIDPKSPSKNTAIKICEHIGEYPRLTFDCRGSQLSNEIAINATKTGGKVVVMTNSDDGIPIPVSDVITRDIDIIVSTFGNDESDVAALRFLSTNKVFFSNAMNKHYDLSNVHEAFEHLHGPNRFDSQVIVKCGCKCGENS